MPQPIREIFISLSELKRLTDQWDKTDGKLESQFYGSVVFEYIVANYTETKHHSQKQPKSLEMKTVNKMPRPPKSHRPPDPNSERCYCHNLKYDKCPHHL